jgi:hypothetical protein
VNPNTVHTLDSEAELFVDDLLIASKRGVTRRLHQGVKHETPVVAPDDDKPWEHVGSPDARRILVYGTTMYDSAVAKYRMWYMCRMGPMHGHTVPGLYMPRPSRNPAAFMGRTQDTYGRTFVDNDRGDLTCYAESEDGLTWTKPKLGIFAFNTNAENNIVWDLHGVCVFRDDEESDAQKRYKGIGFCRRYRDIFLLTSPDGIRWDDSSFPAPVLTRENEGPFNVVYDPNANLFRAYAHGRDTDTDKRRMVYYSESPQLSGPWQELKPMLRASPRDDEVGQEKYGAIRAEIHNMSGFPYGNIYIGIAGMLYVTGAGAPGMPIDGPIDAHLVYSRDGVNWHHVDAEQLPIIPRGESGSFDAEMICGTAKEPIINELAIHWYYTGSRRTHGVALKDKYKAIGRATWRKDGFVSLDADSTTGGVVETVPLQIPKGTLHLNAYAVGGNIQVEVLDADGQIQSGFSSDDCVPTTGDGIRHPVRWRNSVLSDARHPLRFRFVMNCAKLYSFQVAPQSP